MRWPSGKSSAAALPVFPTATQVKMANTGAPLSPCSPQTPQAWGLGAVGSAGGLNFTIMATVGVHTHRRRRSKRSPVAQIEAKLDLSSRSRADGGKLVPPLLHPPLCSTASPLLSTWRLMMKEHGGGIQISRRGRLQKKNAESVFGREEIRSECLMSTAAWGQRGKSGVSHWRQIAFSGWLVFVLLLLLRNPTKRANKQNKQKKTLIRRQSGSHNFLLTEAFVLTITFVERFCSPSTVYFSNLRSIIHIYSILFKRRKIPGLCIPCSYYSSGKIIPRLSTYYFSKIYASKHQ